MRWQKVLEVRAALGNEGRQFGKLTEADRRLHVGHLEVISDVAVGVFMIVSGRQVAQREVVAFPAGIVLPRVAPAVASPIAERFDELFQDRAVGEHGPPFAHRQVVRRVKAHGRNVAECAHRSTVIFGADRVAHVFDQPQIVFVGERTHGGQIERIAQGMRQDDGSSAVRNRLFQARNIEIVGRDIHIQKNGDRPVLRDRINRGGKTGRHRNHFVSRLQAALAEHRRRQRRYGQQIGNRS